MTVKQLKEYLSNFSDDTRIVIDEYDNSGYEDITIYPTSIINESGLDEEVLYIS